MDFPLLLLFSVFSAILLKFLFNLFFPSAGKLPPGPPSIPFIGSSVWFTQSLFDINAVIRSLHSRFGPIITLYLGSRPVIFVADGSLAHQALVQNGAVFADRPPAVGMEAINTSNRHTVSSASYGSTWRLLRRNLTSEILHPSRVASYSNSRGRVLQILRRRLEAESKSGGEVRVIDHFKYAMFCLLALICVGENLSEDQIDKIEDAQRQFLLNYVGFSVFGFCPSVTKIVFRKMWKQYLQIRANQENALIPLMRARKEMKEQRESKNNLSYIDTLLDLQLPKEKRKLTEEEMVSLCSEFFNGGTETTSTALQWIMANLVKHPKIQQKLYMELKSVVANREGSIKEDDLQKLPYLKAVVLEGLRLHPPAHMVIPHTVTEETELGGYRVPKNAVVNFMVAEIGRDPRVWEEPMEFKPERFEGGEVIDVSGSKEVKMMPFGAGRRICPGLNLAILHLEYFVGNLIWSYEWKAMEGEDVDLSEKLEFSVTMKNPLQACIFPRL